jgi:hypothetical protein
MDRVHDGNARRTQRARGPLRALPLPLQLLLRRPPLLPQLRAHRADRLRGAGVRRAQLGTQLALRAAQQQGVCLSVGRGVCFVSWAGRRCTSKRRGPERCAAAHPS